MKAALIMAVVLAAAGMMGGNASAAEPPSVAYGKKLFNDPALGGSTNSKSCNSCHPLGKGLETAGSRPGLVQTINRCITVPLKGKAIAENSVEMQSLRLYIESLKPLNK